MTMLEIARLTPQERLDLMGELLDSLSSEDIALTAAQDAELARRMTTFDEDVKTSVSWETLEARLAQRPR